MPNLFLFNNYSVITLFLNQKVMPLLFILFSTIMQYLQINNLKLSTVTLWGIHSGDTNKEKMKPSVINVKYK